MLKINEIKKSNLLRQETLIAKSSWSKRTAIYIVLVSPDRDIRLCAE